jgi:hypothetical protein
MADTPSYPGVYVEEVRPGAGVPAERVRRGRLRADGRDARGVWKAPAGTDAHVVGAVRPAVAIGDDDGRTLNARGVNCVRRFHGSGAVVWGARTLRGADGLASDWKYVNVRRLALFVEASIERGLRWAVFEPNCEPLWARVRAAVEAFMRGVFRDGALRGATPREAFYVRCDRTTMTQADVDAGVLIVAVGMAAVRPAEFVELRVRVMVRPGEC